jgi:protocatechuate 3,4-dioxygenase, alpha subunit
VTLPRTPSQTVGPFFGFALPYGGGPQLVSPETPGAVRIEGRLIDGQGEPVPDGLIEIMQADPSGAFAGPNGGAAGFQGFGRCSTGAEGEFSFVTLKPGPVPYPDGRVQAPHLEVLVFARGLLNHLVTRIYFPDEGAANAADPVLSSIEGEAARATLVARDAGNGVLVFDIHLQGYGETAFFAFR